MGSADGLESGFQWGDVGLDLESTYPGPSGGSDHEAHGLVLQFFQVCNCRCTGSGEAWSAIFNNRSYCLDVVGSQHWKAGTSFYTCDGSHDVYSGFCFPHCSCNMALEGEVRVHPNPKIWMASHPFNLRVLESQRRKQRLRVEVNGFGLCGIDFHSKTVAFLGDGSDGSLCLVCIVGACGDDSYVVGIAQNLGVVSQV